MLRRSIILLGVAVCSFGQQFDGPEFAQADPTLAQNSRKLQMSFNAPKASYLIGESICLTFTITNPTSASVETYKPFSGGKWGVRRFQKDSPRAKELGEEYWTLDAHESPAYDIAQGTMTFAAGSTLVQKICSPESMPSGWGSFNLPPEAGRYRFSWMATGWVNVTLEAPDSYYPMQQVAVPGSERQVNTEDWGPLTIRDYVAVFVLKTNAGAFWLCQSWVDRRGESGPAGPGNTAQGLEDAITGGRSSFDLLRSLPAVPESWTIKMPDANTTDIIYQLAGQQTRFQAPVFRSTVHTPPTITQNPSETISTPAAPSGPANGVSGSLYKFSASGAASSLGHTVQYSFDWGDGTHSGWTPQGVTSSYHTWTAPGAYTVTVQARCTTDNIALSTASAGFLVNIAGESISTPASPVGAAAGTVGIASTFTASGASSSLGHDVRYRFIFGDGSVSPWLTVGTTNASYTWVAAGTYQVKVEARCATDTQVISTQSAPLAVVVAPRTP